MAEFSELVKNFDKIRDYMRDFFVYGFKSRNDFTQKSSRTYDNERRRIESYLGEYIKWDTSKKGKRVFISLDSSRISQNPLYSAWKSKSFTTNDIMLHFYILDILSHNEDLNIEELTNHICINSGICFDVQTVRIKANEYVKEGILKSCKCGKAFFYSLSDQFLYNLAEDYNGMLDAIKYYQEAAPFGVVGSYLLDSETVQNEVFNFKHHFIMHTLEDKVLLEILKAVKEKKKICFVNHSGRTQCTNVIVGIPLKIFVSCKNGRRYVTIYNKERNRFVNHRLDYIKSVEILDEYKKYDYIKNKLEQNLDKCWGVSFSGSSRKEEIQVKLYINEKKETYILKRLEREGRGGIIQKLDKNIYLYTNEVFDINEMMPWVKSFTGRIISVEGTSKLVIDRFNNDMKRMYDMYLGGEQE